MSDISLLVPSGVHSYSNCEYRVINQFDFSEFYFTESVLLEIYPYLISPTMGRLLFQISVNCSYLLNNLPSIQNKLWQRRD